MIEFPGYYILRDVELLQGGNFYETPSLVLGQTFTADPVTDYITTPGPHGQVDGNRISLSSTIMLPDPLWLVVAYGTQPGDFRVINSTATTMQLADDNLWPIVSIYDITDVGTGIHSMWIDDLTGNSEIVNRIGPNGAWGLETAFFPGGVVNASGGAGGTSTGGGEERSLAAQRTRTIIKTPQDLQALAARAQKSIEAFDNFSIVGQGFSKSPHGHGWMFNPLDSSNDTGEP